MSPKAPNVKSDYVDEHPAHKKALDSSRFVTQVAVLYRSIGMRRYGYDPSNRGSWEKEERKDELDNILYNLFYNQIEYDPATSTFKKSAVELAQKYINTPWLHTPWLTSTILTQILDSELVPLKKEVFGHEVPGRLTSMLPDTWGIFVPMALFCVGFIVELIIVISLFKYKHPVWGLLATGFLLWHVIGRMVVNWKIRRYRKMSGKLFLQLDLVRREVASHNYDPEELDRRLRKSEENGLYVNSLTYSLLKIKTGVHSSLTEEM